jgi:hypothetical protein
MAVARGNEPLLKQVLLLLARSVVVVPLHPPSIADRGWQRVAGQEVMVVLWGQNLRLLSWWMHREGRKVSVK